MDSRQWLNQSQPQTLVIACLLLYLNAAFALLAVLGVGLSNLTTLGLVAVVLTIGGGVAAGLGMAQEKKWGYGLGLVVAFLPFALRLASGASLIGTDLITLIFEIALVALLLHPQSREYQKIWFK